MNEKVSYAVAFISVFGRFSVDDRRKRSAKYAFSIENALMWTGGNKTKTLAWAKIFRFVLVETKNDT